MVGGRIHVPADGVKITTQAADEESEVIEVAAEFEDSVKLYILYGEIC